MASLFKKKNTWYLSVSYKGKRKSKSLNTKDFKVALQLKPTLEVQLLQEVMGYTGIVWICFKCLPPGRETTYQSLLPCYLYQTYQPMLEVGIQE